MLVPCTICSLYIESIYEWKRQRRRRRVFSAWYMDFTWKIIFMWSIRDFPIISLVIFIYNNGSSLSNKIQFINHSLKILRPTKWYIIFVVFPFLWISDGEIQRVLVNGSAQIKCDVSSNIPNDQVLLVVWYKNNLPIYR